VQADTKHALDSGECPTLQLYSETVTVTNYPLENQLTSVFVNEGGSMLLSSEPTSVWLYMQVTVAVGVHAS